MNVKDACSMKFANVLQHLSLTNIAIHVLERLSFLCHLCSL